MRDIKLENASAENGLYKWERKRIFVIAYQQIAAAFFLFFHQTYQSETPKLSFDSSVYLTVEDKKVISSVSINYRSNQQYNSVISKI